MSDPFKISRPPLQPTPASGRGPLHANHANPSHDSGMSFGAVMNGVADGALATMSTIGAVVPGGGLLTMAAEGIKALKDGAAYGGGGPDDQIDKMWAMQQESQMFNLQYLNLQTAIQDDNRRFSTMSNLMKARHDTAKSAINNMHV